MLALQSSAAAFPDCTRSSLSSLGLSKSAWSKTASNNNHVLLVWLLLLEQSPPNDYGFINGASGNITLATEGISSFGRIKAMMVSFSFCFDKWTYLIGNLCRSDFGFFKKRKNWFVALINCSFTLLINCPFALLINCSFILLINCSFTLLINCSFTLLINCSFTLLKWFSNSLTYSGIGNLVGRLYVSNVSYVCNLEIASFFYITYLT